MCHDSYSQSLLVCCPVKTSLFAKWFKNVPFERALFGSSEIAHERERITKNVLPPNYSFDNHSKTVSYNSIFNLFNRCSKVGIIREKKNWTFFVMIYFDYSINWMKLKLNTFQVWLTAVSLLRKPIEKLIWGSFRARRCSCCKNMIPVKTEARWHQVFLSSNNLCF